MADLQRDTELAGSGGTLTGHIGKDWCVWSPQGGYLMAIAMRAAGRSTSFKTPLALSCQFLSVPKVGPIEVGIVSLRRTRGAECVRISMRQEERAILEAVVWAGEAAEGYAHCDPGMPDVPAFEALTATAPVESGGAVHTLWGNIEQRPCGPLHWERRSPSEPRQRDWMRLRSYEPSGDAFVEAGRYALFLDTFTWPAAAHAHVGDPRFITPTLMFAIDFHARTDSTWILSDAYSPIAGGGRVSILNRLWSPARELIATASGTMLCRPRPSVEQLAERSEARR